MTTENLPTPRQSTSLPIKILSNSEKDVLRIESNKALLQLTKLWKKYRKNQPTKDSGLEHEAENKL